jgi:N-acetylmuramoyl-L-alanine amidase
LFSRLATVFSPLRSAAAVLAAVVAALLISTALAGQAPQPQPPGSPLTILSRDARRPLPVATIGRQEFVALDDLAAAFQLAVREEAGAITVTYRGRTIILTPNQALASVAGRLVSLPAAVTRSGTRWLVPPEFISRALGPIYDSRIELRRPSRLVIVGDLRVPRVTIRHEPSAAAARLTVDIVPAAPHTMAQETGRLMIRFEADAIDPVIPAIPSPGVVQAIRVADPIALAIDLGPRFASFRASTQPLENLPGGATGSRLVLDLLAAATETAAPPPPSLPPSAAPPPELPTFGTPVSAIRTIAIDPGHGGDDIGARGASGTEEKELTLAVARRLKATIEGRLGIRVLLTRESDRSVPLEERTAVANNNKADLFISLHANASVRPAATGATVYVAAFDDADETQTDFQPERVPVFGGGSRDIELVLWDVAQIRYIDQSGEFARMLEDELRTRLSIPVRPTDRAPFRVLEAANMPAVLIEMGFLTNEGEAQRLSASDFQSAFVQAVYDAIGRFRGYLTAPAGEP